MVVHKYQLNITEPTTIWLPEDHTFRYCTSIDNKVYAWIEKDAGELSPYQFQVITTGEEFYVNFGYCGTFITQFGFVGHVYALGRIISEWH